MVYRMKADYVKAFLYGYTYTLFIAMMRIFCFEKFSYTHF